MSHLMTSNVVLNVVLLHSTIHNDINILVKDFLGWKVVFFCGILRVCFGELDSKVALLCPFSFLLQPFD